MNRQELNALIDNYFTRHTNQPSILWPRGDADNMRWDNMRCIARHNGKWYVQTSAHSVENAEGDKYDTLEQAVVCAVALMELEA